MWFTLIVGVFYLHAVTSEKNVGCVFDSALCGSSEVCQNDGVFGICTKQGETTQEKLELPAALDERTIEQLVKELSRLWNAGYRWHHPYSQCVVKSVLFSIKNDPLYDPGLCSRSTEASTPIVSEKVSLALEQIEPQDMAQIKFMPNLGAGYADEVFLPPANNGLSTPITTEESVSVYVDNAKMKRASPIEETEPLSRDQTNDFVDVVLPQDYLYTILDADTEVSQENEVDDENVLEMLDYLRRVARETAAMVQLENDVAVARAVEKAAQIQQLQDQLKNEVNDEETNEEIDSVSLPDKVIMMADAPAMHSFSGIMDPIPKDEELLEGEGAIKRSDPSWDFPAFRRPMRLDTKKPGPFYFVHEPDSEEDDPFVNERFRRLLLNKMASYGDSDEEFEPKSEEGVPLESMNMILDENSAEDENVNTLKHLGQTGLEGQMEKPMLIPLAPSANYQLRSAVPATAQMPDVFYPPRNVESVDATRTYITLQQSNLVEEKASKFLEELARAIKIPPQTFSNIRLHENEINFKVNPNNASLNASSIAEKAGELSAMLKQRTGLSITSTGIGDENKKYEMVSKEPLVGEHLFLFSFVLCGSILGIILGTAAVYMIRRHARSKEKLQGLADAEGEPGFDYQDLCRQKMAAKEKSETVHVTPGATGTETIPQSPAKRPPHVQHSDNSQNSSRSSTSSWSEEPVTSNMDISTGHMILSYMEDHLKCKERLEHEWEALCAYEPEPSATTIASLDKNANKNRYPHNLPFDHARVMLTEASNESNSDYINASTITDHDPRNPAYIATQGPLPHTTADFWQMVWEQGSVVIVMLTRLMENGIAMCHRYWPEEGSECYHLYEVHLVSEHIWCDDYLVRSFYLKNLKTGETRTVTQFHFLSWPDNGIPVSIKALLEFRRKVNKSYRSRSCPIVVHCSDGTGRTGTYILLDMVLNRMVKGTKEIDIAATLEHIRDQRNGMIKTKAQFEFVLMAIAEEVHAILKALSH